MKDYSLMVFFLSALLSFDLDPPVPEEELFDQVYFS